MVKGKIPHVMKVMEAVMDKIREKVDPNCAPDQFDHKGIQRTKEVSSTNFVLKNVADETARS